MNKERNLPIEFYDNVQKEITPVDMLIGLALSLGVGVGSTLITLGLYVKYCQEHKGIIIKEGE